MRPPSTPPSPPAVPPAPPRDANRNLVGKERAAIASAKYVPPPKGKHEIQQVNVWGNVLISTATEIVRAEKGVYNVRTGIVRLQGNVKITRGKTQLSGNDAEVDLNSGISRLIGGKGRVQGLIQPRKRQ